MRLAKCFIVASLGLSALTVASTIFPATPAQAAKKAAEPLPMATLAHLNMLSFGRDTRAAIAERHAVKELNFCDNDADRRAALLEGVSCKGLVTLFVFSTEPSWTMGFMRFAFDNDGKLLRAYVNLGPDERGALAQMGKPQADEMVAQAYDAVAARFRTSAYEQVFERREAQGKGVAFSGKGALHSLILAIDPLSFTYTAASQDEMKNVKDSFINFRHTVLKR